jgi:hypothetical protein
MEKGQQYLRQKMGVGRAFEVELLTQKRTDNLNQQKAHERYCSTFALPDTASVENDAAANETNRERHNVYPGPCDDVEHCTMERAWGQLSNGPAVVSHANGLGEYLVDGGQGLSAEAGGRVSVGR